MKKCMKCGAEMADEAVFCSLCGKKYRKKEQNVKRELNIKLPLPVAIAIPVAVLLALFAVIVFAGKTLPEKLKMLLEYRKRCRKQPGI